jgi:antitoxin (DNA-binding transcriptional repressor) of toxin-antitoxin stability system
MKSISIRQLHQDTGKWVRHAATRGAIVVTDRGARVAAIGPIAAAPAARALPDREDRIRRRPRLDLDSAAAVSDMRDRA